jgi:hypothetical protein
MIPARHKSGVRKRVAKGSNLAFLEIVSSHSP